MLGKRAWCGGEQRAYDYAIDKMKMKERLYFLQKCLLIFKLRVQNLHDRFTYFYKMVLKDVFPVSDLFLLGGSKSVYNNHNKFTDICIRLKI